MPLKEAGHSAGLFAPTIRYHEGVFYVICTNVSYGGNYIVTASNPEDHGLSHIILREQTASIQVCSLMRMENVLYWYSSQSGGCKYDGDWYIWIQELDVKTMKLVGEHKNVWNGAMKNIYGRKVLICIKKGEYYYIMHAEGGTGPDHAVTVCRSKNIWGPYENNFCNPILTHRHLGRDYPVKYVGHADLIETPAGEWYMTMLAVRPKEGYTTMGRETFLAKVVWENDWPVVNPGAGMLTDTVEIELPEWRPETDVNSYTYRTGAKTCVPGSSREYDFTNMKVLGDEFLFLRNPEENMYQLTEKGLNLHFSPVTLKEKASPSYIAIRQQHHRCKVEACLKTDGLTSARRAGIAVVQSDEYQLRVEVGDSKADVILCEKGMDQCVGSAVVEDKEVVLSIAIDELKATVGMKDSKREIILAEDVDIRALSTEVAGGFVGCTAGIYAVAEGEEADGYAMFKSLSYEEREGK